MKLYEYTDYEEYMNAQLAAHHRKRTSTWALQENIQYLAGVVRQCCGKVGPEFGICHGTRGGHEQRWFAQALQCPVIGTEASHESRDIPATVVWDFHRPRSDWIGAADFVYSNALDHAFNPLVALETWSQQLLPGGALLIEHSDDCDGEDAVTRWDPFGADRQEVAAMVSRYCSDVFITGLPAKKPKVRELCCVVGIR